MILRFLPWRFLIKYAARAYGVVDPAAVLARVRSFSQPSEVAEPIELLRAGLLFQARGLVNTRAIQFNLDWVWPYWVERQFNPEDHSFVPRAYSATHVNLTQRNWTAVGLPDLPVYPLCDPRGLITPLFDGWSLDFWVLSPDGAALLPSRQEQAEQALEMGKGLAVVTRTSQGDLSLVNRLHVEMDGPVPIAVVHVRAEGPAGLRLVAALRPYNPEGVSLVEEASWDSNGRAWQVDGQRVAFDRLPDKVLFSNYREGDVFQRLDEEKGPDRIHCRVGMVTAAAVFDLDQGGGEIELRIPLDGELKRDFPNAPRPIRSWEDSLAPTARLEVPDERFRFLYDSALRTLVLLSARQTVPGPYSYRRFWFRDAVFMLHSMLAVGLEGRVARRLARFPRLQQRSGYFRSQDGEWDSNGQVLWLFDRYLEQLTGRNIPPEWMAAAEKAADWIGRKRLKRETDHGRRGLLPAGFSAEHLGPNDYYYWDDFWSLAGLRSAVRLAQRANRPDLADKYRREADAFDKDIRSSIAHVSGRTNGAVPAAPYRRMDAGAVGSLVADYPLQLTAPDDRSIGLTLEWLLENSMHRGGFFQNMIHSGINAYLTLHLAQVLLRKGDGRFAGLVRSIADLATPTGQWPEAIHPFSGGGCMGDGQHGWASAEWVMMVRNMFVREDDGGLVLGSGLLPEWLQKDGVIKFGPTDTPFGRVEVNFTRRGSGLSVECRGWWRGETPQMEARVPGYRSLPLTGSDTGQRLEAE